MTVPAVTVPARHTIAVVMVVDAATVELNRGECGDNSVVYEVALPEARSPEDRLGP